jgi:transcriptional regulator with XRE-family HTH domain
MLRLSGLRTSRERRLYSQGELGRLVGMRAGEIAGIERGDRLVQPETAIRFSQALRVGLHELTESPEERHDRAYNMNRPTPDPMQPVVSCFDPQGRNVVSDLGWWESHIEDQHPEVAGHFDAVALTVQDPDVIMRDVEHDNGENYYRMGALPVGRLPWTDRRTATRGGAT